jgi:hypothetical protein
MESLFETVNITFSADADSESHQGRHALSDTSDEPFFFFFEHAE